MKAYEIIGGYAHICDMCEKDDGRPTLYWKDRDFDLCYPCIKKIYLDYVIDDSEENIYIGVKVIRKKISEELRNGIFKKDNYKCVKCGSREDLVIDHIIPFSKGGVTELDNLQTLCKKCNREKGNKANK